MARLTAEDKQRRDDIKALKRVNAQAFAIRLEMDTLIDESRDLMREVDRIVPVDWMTKVSTRLYDERSGASMFLQVVADAISALEQEDRIAASLRKAARNKVVEVVDNE